MGNCSFVAGVFKEDALAENAIDVLRSLNFSEDQIHYIPRASSREMYRILENLIYLGVPEEEALYYTSELESGHSIVLVRHEGRLGEVLNILFLHGTRKHRYLHNSSYINRQVFDAPASVVNGWHDRQGTSQALSPTSAPRGTETLTEDEMESVRNMLKRAGLDHLL